MNFNKKFIFTITIFSLLLSKISFAENSIDPYLSFNSSQVAKSFYDDYESYWNQIKKGTTFSFNSELNDGASFENKSSYTLAPTISLTSSNQIIIDSNKPCTEGPGALYVSYEFCNTTGSILTDLSAVLSISGTGYSLAGNQPANQLVGNLNPGECISLFWFVQYPCTENASANITVNLMDNGSSIATSTDTVTTGKAISANATGILGVMTVNSPSVGQLSVLDVEYIFGNTSNGSVVSFQPAGNSSFNAECFQLVGLEVLSSQVNGVIAGTTDLMKFSNASASGSNNIVNVRYFFKNKCAGASSLVKPYAYGESGNQLKYTGNFEATAMLSLPPSSIPSLTLEKTSSQSNLSAVPATVTYTITLTNTSSAPISIDQVNDDLPSFFSFDNFTVDSNINAINSSMYPSNGDTGTITFQGGKDSNIYPYTEYYIAANSSINLKYTVNISGTATNGNYPNSVTYTVGGYTSPPAIANVSIGPAYTITANNDDFTSTPFQKSTGGTTPSVFDDNGSSTDDANGSPATDANIDNNISIINNGGLTGATINSDGTINIPSGVNSGTYTLEYQICLTADNSFCDTAEVVIYINDDPVAINDSYSTNEGTPITITPLTTGVADSDPDGDTLTITNINGTNVTPGIAQSISVPNGSVDISVGGIITFTPNPNFVGDSSFPYSISDGNGGSDTAQIDIDILLIPAPALSLDKTANVATYNAVGDVITYSYEVTNAGNVTLNGPFTIADDKLTVTVPATQGPLAVGASFTVTQTHTITQADLDAGSITNVASATDTNSNTDSPTDTVTVTADQSPALTLDKTANVATYNAVGDVITYSYEVTNAGNVTLNGPFTIADDKLTVTVPATQGPLAVGASFTVTQTHTITQADLDAGSITNVASATDTNSNTDSPTDTVTVTADQSPALTVDKTANVATYNAVGDVITYSYEVTNAGNVTLNGPFTIADDKLTVTVPATQGPLAVGASFTVTQTHTITQADLDAGSITNVASATDTNSNTDSPTDTVTVTADQSPALTLDKTANVATYNAVGDVITYSYEVTNAGNVTLNGPFTIADDKLTVTVPATQGPLAVGASFTVTQTHTITQADLDAGSITNVASATDTNSNTDSPTDTVTVTADQSPALTVDKTANVATYNAVGDVITYSYEVTNAGNVTLNGPFTIADDKLTVTVPATQGPLAVGASFTVTQTHTITQADIDAGSITNVASATDTNSNTDSPTDTVTVTADQSPALTVDKTANVATYNAVGDVITYSYEVTNAGNVTLNGPFTIADDKLTVTVPATQGPLAVGASFTVTQTHTITQADLDAGSITNVASATDTNSNTDSPTDTVTVTADQSPALTVDKTANVATYDAVGDVITYSYEVTNAGNVTLNGPFTIADDKLTVTVPATQGPLAVGASFTVTQTHTITQADLDAGSITNVASATDTNSNTDSPTDTVTVTADQSPALTLDKTANVATYNAVGDIITYSYEVTNAGNVTLNGPFTIADDKLTVTVPATQGPLAVGASFTVTQTHTITQADIDAGSITNVASATDTNSNTDSPTDTVTVTADQSPALTVDKTANVATYNAVGDIITYSYEVTNAGNVTLNGPFTIADDKLTVTVPATQGPLAVGASFTVTQTHTITQADLDAGSITNVASATDTNSNTDSPTDTVTVTADQSPALTLDKTANVATYDAVGDVITYSYQVTNTGNVTLAGPFAINDDKITVPQANGPLAPGDSVTVTQTYTVTQNDIDNGAITNIAFTTDGSITSPTDTTTVSPSDSVTVIADQNPAITLEKTANISTYSSVGEVVIYSYKIINSGNVTLAGPFSITDDKITIADAVGSIAPGEHLTVTQTYRITQADIDAGSITNIAFVSDGTTTSPTDSVTITADVNPALTLDKTANVSTYDAVGDQIVYSYKVTNSGDVVIYGPISITDDKLTVSATIGTLSPGASITITEVYTITQADIEAGSITNIASASNGTTTSPTDSVTVTAVQSPALTLNKTADIATYEVGDVITYSYEVTNTGNVTLTGPFAISDDKITVPNGLGPLAPGASVTVNQTYTVVQSDVDNGSITNVASVSDGTTTSPTDTVTVTANAIAPSLLGSIGDIVWYDTDGDGIVDIGENGLEGATVILDPGTPNNTSDDVTVLTDANGNYLFTNLPVGVYTITVDVSTVISGLPATVTIADLIQTFDGDGVGTPNTSTLSLPSGIHNLNQDFAYGIVITGSGGGSGGGVGSGNNGGIESESLGDVVSKIYVGRKKNSVPTEFVKSKENLYNKAQLKSTEPYQGKGQTMLDMFPTELVAGNVANITSPTDILDYTIADEVLSVDFSLDGETKGVVLGIKTSDKVYNHTKASCDRLRGAEILNIQSVQLKGYNFLMQAIKQRNGVVEYAISFAAAKNNNDGNYAIQTNWYVNDYTKFNDVYNFQIWSTKPEYTQKLLTDIISNLQSFIPVQQTEIKKFPKTYASKIYREKGELIVALRSTEVGKTAEVSMVELYSETANNIKFRDNTLTTEIQQALRLDIADGYEYDGLVKVDNEVSDAFYHADGNWGLDYDKRYTEIKNYFVWNDFDREYQDDEYTINRNPEVKATSDYDYLTLYKSLLPGTLSADYSEYKYVSFTAKGSGLMELGLIKSSIEDWNAQYRVMVDFSEEEQTYYVPFEIFSSSATQEQLTADDLTTLTFTFLPVEAQTKDLDISIKDVKFTKTAVEDQIVNKIEKFENEFIAYPNPSQGTINLLLYSKVATEGMVTLFDVTGKTIYSSTVQLTEGKNELNFDFNKIKAGFLFLKVASKEINYGTSKIIFR